MKRRSFLQPTNKTGVLGQKRRISGSHMALQLRNDFGLPIEKHSNTTSDLQQRIFHKYTCHTIRFQQDPMNRLVPTTRIGNAFEYGTTKWISTASDVKNKHCRSLNAIKKTRPTWWIFRALSRWIKQMMNYAKSKELTFSLSVPSHLPLFLHADANNFLSDSCSS